jgi:hypothetical protein
MKRSLPLLAAVLMAVVGLAPAFEPPADKGDDTPRLKKKHRPGDPPKVEEKKPDQPDEIKPEEKKDDKKPDEKKDDKKAQKKEDMPVDEDGPAAPPAEDKQEVLERVAKNMRAVEDGIANHEVNEGLLQKQDDIIKDLKSLLDDNNQNQAGGGGGGGGMNQDNQNDQQQNGGGGGGGGGGAKRQQSRKNMGQGGQGGQGNQGGQQTARQRREQRRRQQGGGQQVARNQGNGGNRPQSGGNGNEPGAGNDKFNPNNVAPRDADPKYDVWGHLPETLRAQMAAYYSDKNFMAKHKDLISGYYRNIAAQGRGKEK